MSIRSASSFSMYSMDFRIAGMVNPGGRGTVPSKSAAGGILILDWHLQSGKLGNGALRHCKIFVINLETHAFQSECCTRSDGGTGAHKGVQDNPFAEGQGGAHKLAKEMLWFERGMGSDSVLRPPCGTRDNKVAKWYLRGDAPKPSRPPFSQVVLYAALAGLAKKPPRLPAGTRHHRNLAEFTVGILGPVTPPKCLHHSNDLATLLKASADERSVNQVGDEGVGGNEHVRTRDHNRHQQCGQSRKEGFQFGLMLLVQYGKTWQRAAFAAIE